MRAWGKWATFIVWFWRFEKSPDDGVVEPNSLSWETGEQFIRTENLQGRMAEVC